MDPSRFLVWLLADVIFGLIHVIAFSAKIIVFSPNRDKNQRVWMPFLGTGVLFAYTITLLATHMGQMAQALLASGRQTGEQTFMIVFTVGVGLLLLVFCTILFTLTNNDIINEAELGISSERRDNRKIGLTSIALFIAGLIIAFLTFDICTTAARTTGG